MKPAPRPPAAVPQGAREKADPPRQSRRAGGLVGSIALHAVVIAAACAIYGNAVGDGGKSGENADAGPFLMSAPAAVAWGKSIGMPALATRRAPVSRAVAVDLPGSPAMWTAAGKSLEIFPSSTGYFAPGRASAPGNSDSKKARRKSAPRPQHTPPHPLASPPPAYPRSARRAGISGTVAVLVQVHGDGAVAGTSIYRGSGDGALDQAAAAAVRRWRFSTTPGLAAGTTMTVIVRVHFAL